MDSLFITITLGAAGPVKVKITSASTMHDWEKPAARNARVLAEYCNCCNEGSFRPLGQTASRNIQSGTCKLDSKKDFARVASISQQSCLLAIIYAFCLQGTLTWYNKSAGSRDVLALRKAEHASAAIVLVGLC